MRIIRGLIVWLTVALSLFGLYFLIITSLKSKSEFADNYFLPPLNGFHWENWAQVVPVVLQPAGNSISLAFWTVLGLLVVTTPAAYVFTWHRFPGKERLFTLAIITIMIPSVLTFVPQFVLVKQMGLMDTQPAVILPGIAGSIGVAVFLLRTFFRALPFELIEAARLDGASELQTLRRVVLPLTVPALITVAVLTVVGVWNNFLWPLVVLPSASNRTATVAVTYFASDPMLGSGSNFPLLMAAYLISSVPLIIIIGSMLRYFMAGATQGSVKL